MTYIHVDVGGKMAQEFPSLCVPSEWPTKSRVSCSYEDMSLSCPREMEGAEQCQALCQAGPQGTGEQA